MRGWLLVSGLLLASLVGMPSTAAQDNLDGPVTLSFQITENGAPVDASLFAGQQVEGVSRWAEVRLVDGLATLHVQPGRLDLHLRGPPPTDRMYGFGELQVDQDTTYVVDVASTAATVPVDIRFADAETGEPLEVDLYAPQMLFGDYLCVGFRSVTRTAQPSTSGSPPQPDPPQEPCDLQWAEPNRRLVGKVPAGVFNLRAENKDYSMCIAGADRPSGLPCALYTPVSRSFAAVEGSSVEATVSLLPVPTPDSDVEGYLVSEVTGQAIPRKHMFVQGTGDFASVFFSAYLDEDGSYHVRIPAGRYTIRGDVCGHDQRTLAFDAIAGQTTRLDVRLYGYGQTPTTPTSSSEDQSTDANGGTSSGVGGGGGGSSAGSSYTGASGPYSYPACDVTPTPTFTGAPEPDPEPVDGDETDPGSDPPPTVQVVGLLAMIDFRGGLGPLGGVPATQQDDDQETPVLDDPVDADDRNGDGSPWRFVPGLPLLATVAVLGLLGLAARRRLP